MLIMLDNSNLFAGGGIQVAISFLTDLLSSDTSGLRFIVVQSFGMQNLVDQRMYPANFEFVQLHETEQKSIRCRNRTLKELEASYRPEVIFTTFGPSYYKSQCPKIVGFAIGHIIYRDSPYFKTLSLKERWKDRLLCLFKKEAFKRYSDVLIFESEAARIRIAPQFNGATFTVNNTLNGIFYEPIKWVPVADTSLYDGRFNILSIASPYAHKNLAIIPQVIDSLLESGVRNFQFILTVRADEIHFDQKYLPYLVFLGKVTIEEVPALYQVADVLFMPTLLELFSTSYLEGMFMGVPIVASELPFAFDICGDAASYCEPTVGSSYATAIKKIKDDPDYKHLLIARGKVKLQSFGTSMDRTEQYLAIIKKTTKKNGNKR